MPTNAEIHAAIDLLIRQPHSYILTGAIADLLDDMVDSAGGGGITEITYANLQTAISGNDLTAGATYKITDRGDRGLFFQAISTNELSRTGVRKMLCPAFYGIGASGGNTWIGVWNTTKNPNVGDLTIWGGLVFESVTGNIGTATTDILLDVVNWVVIPKASFSNGEYIEMQFGVSYDVTNDWIEEQCDGSGNVFGANFSIGGGDPNYCDISDWNYATSGNDFHNNVCAGVYNNSCSNITRNNVARSIFNNRNDGHITGIISLADVSNNSNAGRIIDNIMTEDITGNSNDGEINNNRVQNIINNSNAGDINDNTVITISGNSNVGGIYMNKNNGEIINCDSGANPCNIHHNVNNGNISGTFAADVLDTIVNK